MSSVTYPTLPNLHITAALSAAETHYHEKKGAEIREQEATELRCKALQDAYQSWKDTSQPDLKVFATKCIELWREHKGEQGNRKGKLGFKKTLKNLDIKERDAYYAMWECFPDERPTSQHSVAKLHRLPRLDLKQLKADATNPEIFKRALSEHLQALVTVLCKNYQVGATLTVDLK